ncbi:unnamed protein product [Prorocentrum cordatum]|uniref:Uncharacterized protein n=1 Tax=Prorocentrum cordatum TaxID=2364126 RepID=A0ABN9XX12_9DINO|nr:unnamed protein product [Polarella glacialis]
MTLEARREQLHAPHPGGQLVPGGCPGRARGGRDRLPDAPSEGLQRRRTVFVGIRVAQREPSHGAAPGHRRHRRRPPRDASPTLEGTAAAAARRPRDPGPPAERRGPDASAAAVRRFSMAELRHRALPSVARPWRDDG